MRSNSLQTVHCSGPYDYVEEKREIQGHKRRKAEDAEGGGGGGESGGRWEVIIPRAMRRARSSLTDICRASSSSISFSIFILLLSQKNY